MDEFIVARNPDAASSLPYLLRLPVGGGLWLKAAETWPRTARIYCHPADAPDLATLDVVERVPVHVCERRGAAIDLVLDRVQNRRSQFVFTAHRGRSLILWQTSKAAISARPGVRIPFSPMTAGLRVCVDTRERYGYRFAGRGVTVERRALVAGDYAVVRGDAVLASVERKSLENFAASLNDGSLDYAMADLARLPNAAVVVEAPYSAFVKYPHSRAGYMIDLVARVQVRHPSVPVVFLESRKLAEEWTFRFLRAALAYHAAPDLRLAEAPAAHKPDPRTAKPRRKRSARSDAARSSPTE
jgi:hypothetical protein